MAVPLVLENSSKVWERCRIDSIRHVGAANILRALKKHHNDVLRNPDLMFKPFATVFTPDTIIVDVPAKLYFLLVVKTGGSNTNAWVKGSDHATTAAAAGDIVVPMIGTGGGGKSQLLCFPDGLPLINGLVLQSHTTVNGNTASTGTAAAPVDGSSGFAILGG